MKCSMFHLLILTSAILLAGCGLAGTQGVNLSKASTADLGGDLSKASTADLVRLLENEKGGDNFLEIISEFTRRGSSASEAAPALARALAYNRRDSIIACRPLVAMGWAAHSAIPVLFENLSNERADVRLGSAFVLGTIGSASKCAVPKLGSLLWDSDSGVRSAAAAALQSITGAELVDPGYELDPTIPGSVFLDEPVGKVSANARSWWSATGKNTNWLVDDCKPRE